LPNIIEFFTLLYCHSLGYAQQEICNKNYYTFHFSIENIAVFFAK